MCVVISRSESSVCVFTVYMCFYVKKKDVWKWGQWLQSQGNDLLNKRVAATNSAIWLKVCGTDYVVGSHTHTNMHTLICAIKAPHKPNKSLFGKNLGTYVDNVYLKDTNLLEDFTELPIIKYTHLMRQWDKLALTYFTLATMIYIGKLWFFI